MKLGFPLVLVVVFCKGSYADSELYVLMTLGKQNMTLYTQLSDMVSAFETLLLSSFAMLWCWYLDKLQNLHGNLLPLVKNITFHGFQWWAGTVYHSLGIFKWHFRSIKTSPEIIIDSNKRHNNRQWCNLHGDLLPSSVKILCSGTPSSGGTPSAFHQTDYLLCTQQQEAPLR